MVASSNIKAGRAYVEVTAETSALKRNLTSAQAHLKDFGKACQGLGRDMLALGGALSLPFIVSEKSFAGFDDKMRLVHHEDVYHKEQLVQHLSHVLPSPHDVYRYVHILQLQILSFSP